MKIKTLVSQHGAWLLPFIAMAVLTPFTPWLDLTITRYFYEPENGFSSSSLSLFLFNYGVIPAQIAFILSAGLLFFAAFFKKWKQWQSPALVMVLTLIIGAGLITHVIFKDQWGRPRPKQVIEFGGNQSFRPYYQPNFFNQPEPSKSFPCGHCTMGFYFFALALVAKRLNNRPLFWTALLLALTLGIALSFTRIVQGGHFFSDIVASGVIMWLTAYLCDRCVYFDHEKSK